MQLLRQTSARPVQQQAAGLHLSHHRPRTVAPRRWDGAACSAAADSEPTVTLRLLTEAGQEPVEVPCPSGEQLRACMLENKVDLYTTWGKIWSCGGAGQCGTCIVQVQEDAAQLLSERTATEDKKLNKKPASWRLACQTIVGDGEHSGTVVIQTKPQSK